MLSDRSPANAGLEEAYEMLGRIPFFAGVRREAVGIEPLGSLTNVGYKVTVGGTAYALRLPGDYTGEYVDRASEEHNSRIAATAGIGAEVLYFDARSGSMVSRFIEGDTLDGARLVLDAETLARVTQTLRKVHGLGRGFWSRFDVFGMIERFRTLLRRLREPLPAGYEEAERGAEAVRRALEAAPRPFVPCHNDPWPYNFIDAGGRIHLIDWEFSGMNDPFWDLASLSVESGFSPEGDRRMMEAYLNTAVPEELCARVELYKAMGDLLWSLWGAIQHANGNPLDDFLAYSRDRFVRCEERMDSRRFSRSLEIVSAGRRTNVPTSTPF